MALLGMSKGDAEESDGAETGGKEAALKDFFTAGKSGDWAAAAEAFQRAYDECAMEGNDADDMEEMPGEEY